MHAIRRTGFGTLVGLFTSALVGCPLLPPPSNPLHAFPAGDSKVVLLERPVLDLAPPDETLSPDKHDVQELDVQSGQLRTVLTDLAAYPGDVVANERWIAWIERSTDTIQIFDRRAQSQRRLFEEQVAPQPNPADADGRLLAIVGDQLIGHTLALDPYRPGSDACYTFVTFDLQTGDVRYIDGSWTYATFASDGEWIAFFDCGPSAAELQGLELRTNLQLVHLATGVGRTIRPDIRVDGTGEGRIAIVNGVVYWEEFYDGSFRSRVRSYDTASDKLSDVFDDFARRDVDRELLAVRSDLAVVLTHPDGNGEILNPASIELWRFSGSKTTIYESVALQLNFSFRAWLLGDSVVWFDPDAPRTRVIAFDLSTGQTRRIALGNAQ